MKNIVLGAIVLFFLALSITLVEVSCQKLVAQPGGQTSSSSSGQVLYIQATVFQIIPFTHTDSAGNVINDRIDTLYAHDIYTCNFDGNNRTKIPITLAPGLEIGGGPKFTSNGSAIIFDVGAGSVFVNGQYTRENSDLAGIYTCNLDGSGLKRIVEQPQGIVGSVSVADGY